MHDIKIPPLKIGYVLKRFPRLTETFLLNEMIALEQRGVEIEIFSLLRPPAEPRHQLLDRLRANVTYLPSSGAVAKLRLHTGIDAGETRLADLLEDGMVRDPVLSGKSADEAATLHVKAAVLALLARLHGLHHLHAHFGSDATTVALLAGRLSGLGYSFTAHARDIFHTYVDELDDARMRRAKIGEARFVATVSDYNVRHLTGLCPDAAGRIFRLYNGIDLTRFTPDPSRRLSGRIIATGRLIEKKGFGVLVEACRLMAERGQDFECVIVGEGPDRASLVAQIAAANLQDSIRLAGALAQEDLIEEMQSASVSVLPCVVSESGDRDGLPTVLLEAMALALPVVTTTVSGGPEIVADGETGLLCEPGNAGAIADALGQMLSEPDAARQMGVNGRRRAERLFDLDRNAATLHRHFADAAGLRQPTRSVAP